jgi:hypothetical protein
MLWVTLTRIGIKPEKGLGIYKLNSASKVSALKLLQPTCLCLGLCRVLRKPGLGKPFGKTSLAKTAFELGRFISMRDRNSCTGRVGTVIHLKTGLMKHWRGVCPGHWRREGKTEGKPRGVPGLTKPFFMVFEKSPRLNAFLSY